MAASLQACPARTHRDWSTAIMMKSHQPRRAAAGPARRRSCYASPGPDHPGPAHPLLHQPRPGPCHRHTLASPPRSELITRPGSPLRLKNGRSRVSAAPRLPILLLCRQVTTDARLPSLQQLALFDTCPRRPGTAGRSCSGSGTDNFSHRCPNLHEETRLRRSGGASCRMTACI